MEYFRNIVEILVMISVLIAAIRSYLQVNQKWKWKHDKNVAESISVLACIIGVIASMPFLIKFIFIDQTLAPSVNMVVVILKTLIFASIGIGIWVVENQGEGLRALLVKAIHMDKKEKGNLVKSFIKPKGAEEVVRILSLVAAVDSEIAEEEVQLIQDFCEHWKIAQPDLKVGKVEREVDIITLRKSMVEYLNRKPHPEQAAQLLDILQLLIKADTKVTREEEMICEEFSAMINNYTDAEDSEEMRHEVLLIPQNHKQIELIQSLLPETRPMLYQGGRIFKAQKFSSETYAEAVCQRYIKLGVCAVWMDASD